MVAEVRHDDGEPAAFGYPTQSHRLWVVSPCETTVELEGAGRVFCRGGAPQSEPSAQARRFRAAVNPVFVGWTPAR